MTKPDASDPTEWKLLHAAATEPTELAALAAYCEQHARWDEMSAVRSRMLALAPPAPGPAPGGPFPRIGLATPHPGAPTVLARWLNPTDLPELYSTPQVTQTDLVTQLRARPPSRATQLELAAVLCSQLAFADAAALYDQLLADHDDPAVRARSADVHRILGR